MDEDELEELSVLIERYSHDKDFREMMEIWEAIPSDSEIEEMYKTQFKTYQDLQDSKHWYRLI